MAGSFVANHSNPNCGDVHGIMWLLYESVGDIYPKTIMDVWIEPLKFLVSISTRCKVFVNISFNPKSEKKNYVKLWEIIAIVKDEYRLFISELFTIAKLCIRYRRTITEKKTSWCYSHRPHMGSCGKRNKLHWLKLSTLLVLDHGSFGTFLSSF